MRLRTNDRDFRELLPHLDTRVYKNPFITSVVWKRLGDKFDLDKWKKYLKKIRVRLVVTYAKTETVSAVYLEEEQVIQVYITKPNQWTINSLKFVVIQTIMHEYVHAHQFYCHPEQYDRMIVKCTPKTDEEYLSSFGEVQAYAHCYAIDMFYKFDTTRERYEKCDPKVKRLLFQQALRWYHKHKNP